MKVLKFGGTSVGSVGAIENIEAILKLNDPKEKLILVCSALSGVTNSLLAAGELAYNEEDFTGKLKEIENRHYEVISGLLPRTAQNPLLMNIKNHINELEYVLSGIKVLNELSPRVLDYVASFGERMSNPIVAAYLESKGFDAAFVDSRNLIKTDSNFGNAEVKQEETEARIKDWYNVYNHQIAVVTGFIGSDDKGDITTLGRGGSDYTAAIIGAALDADIVEIWTDVDGCMTADPRLVKKAYTLKELSYQEAMEMSYFGAKVIYPPTMLPVIDKKIPIVIKNTFNPEHEGTLIHYQPEISGEGLIKGIVSMKDICLVNIYGGGMVGVKGFSGRLFSTLSAAGVNIIFITQASSEHSITFVIAPKDKDRAVAAIHKEFYKELQNKQIREPEIEEDLSILAVVGEKMKSTKGISGKLFRALGKNGINIVAIAQGSTELNISAVIDKSDLAKALNVVHDSLLLSPVKTFNVFCAGTGNIGKELFRQLKNEKENLVENHQIQINIAGISNSRKMILAQNDFINLENWETQLNEEGEKAELSKFIEYVESLNLPNTVFVDNTSSKEVASLYEDLLNKNVSVVTCNKIANSGEYRRYGKLQRLAKKNNVSFLYETNVGAGLPIIKTLQDLIISGDEVTKIEAILSGTISYIFNQYVGDVTFAEVVKQAQDLGYTEPDPRDDLNGLDFSRKMLILAREIGLPLEMKDVDIKDFLPESCLNAPSVDAFYEELEKNEDYFAAFKNKVAEEGKKLRLIGVLEDGKINVEVKSVDATHPFFSLSGSDNIISFTTARYKNTPLVVKGPGAGAEVTAAGVFADLVRVTSV
ncbi:bifunctional aspartate kinase/homoserine dehydrogenase I [Weeksellaceae bacterium TAE3-ERU29]|nr:bifunctional aspartate kinase/homoserine dehydrogenase I [Weeksellaceae bacterium TAE3-ERU29]